MKPVEAKRGGRTRPRGRKPVEVKEKPKKIIICRVEIDGEMQAEKTMYFPELHPKRDFDLDMVDAHDLKAIQSVVEKGVDFIAVPCVETKEDLSEVKDLLEVKGRHIKLLAKVQNRNALQNLQEILDLADGIVIERGYLGMEFQLEDVDFIKRYIIKRCNLVDKPVILSTQIMESMVRRLQPTRAEVNDISNAVLQGIDCCVLTGETATGPHFREATSYLSKICYETECGLPYESNNLKR